MEDFFTETDLSIIERVNALDKFKIGDYVTRFTEDGKSTYKLIERIVANENVIRYTGKIDGGSSVSLACKPGNDFLTIGSDWYTANIKESRYSFRLLQDI